MTPLIDATEMYLRTVWELEEEGIPPLRARLVDRLQLSAPAVSETVARLQVEGLLELSADRRITLTEQGRAIAASVMRKHRLAERLLTDVIGLDWEEAHNEACRWEHVISDAVEERLVALLADPDTSPFGNPIPHSDTAETWNDLITADQAARTGAAGVIERISERLQMDVATMRCLREAGIRPGITARFELSDGAVTAVTEAGAVPLPEGAARRLYVRTLPA